MIPKTIYIQITNKLRFFQRKRMSFSTTSTDFLLQEDIQKWYISSFFLLKGVCCK